MGQFVFENITTDFSEIAFIINFLADSDGSNVEGNVVEVVLENNERY